MPAIIGTAGHIDHGKTALIRALTGQDTDRLKEEKERGISIDLGFAYFERPDGTRAGIVDVPGHERFIRNMLAGAHGMDVVLLVVAADDGVMPQTQEHLEILDLLGVSRGIAVITKTDLVAAERVAAVRDQVAALLAATTLGGAPVVEVSAPTGAGITALKDEIERQVAKGSHRDSSGYFRLPVDRAFVVKGHGVVVTGTAVSGTLREGESLRLLPSGRECRARALQVHWRKVGKVTAGQRVALNLAGLEQADVHRGHVLVRPQLTRATACFAALVRILPSARAPLKSHAPIRLYAGTAEAMGKVIVLEAAGALRGGEEGLCQVVLDDEVVVFHGDRFVLRDQAGQRTLGGGRVLQPYAVRQHPGSRDPQALRALAAARNVGETLAGLVRASAEIAPPVAWLGAALNAPEEEILPALRSGAALVLLPDAGAPEAVMAAEAVDRIQQATLATLAKLHRESPLLPGMEMESLRSQVAPQVAPRLYRALVEQLEIGGSVRRAESVVSLSTHQVALSTAERELAARAEALLSAGEFKPPSLRELEAALGLPRARLLEILSQLEREGRVSRIGPDLYFARAPLERARQLLAAHVRRHGHITAATFRDLIAASRRFSIGLLDYFDRTGFTLRVGDVRKLGRSS